LFYSSAVAFGFGGSGPDDRLNRRRTGIALQRRETASDTIHKIRRESVQEKLPVLSSAVKSQVTDADLSRHFLLLKSAA
jgi:hypothetical protein